MTNGSLHIVGTGIRPTRHLTPEAAEAIRNSQQLLYLIPDPAAAEFIISLAGGETIDAGTSYQSDAPLADAYERMIGRALECVKAGNRTCFALYGHPGVMVNPSHRLLRLARSEGYEVIMLPAVSAEDCLFADLGIDPATQGCQTFWATDLLLNRRLIDPTTATVIWSIGVVGCLSCSSSGMAPNALLSLLNRLYSSFPPTHPVVVYEAATVAGQPHRAEAIPLNALPAVTLDGASTLYIPPVWPTVPEWQQYAEFNVPIDAVTQLFRSDPPITNG